MGMEAGLKITDLSCAHQQIHLFTHLSCQINPGNALIIQGPNGSGKSSLLRLLAGLTTPTNGHIYWQDKTITTDLRAYQLQLHFISHQNGLKLSLTALENLQLMQTLAQDRSQDIEKILATFALSQQKQVQANYLSAGQKRRLALARLLLIKKPLWLIDEPLTALDIATQALFLSLLETHLQQGGIAVLSTHHALSVNAMTHTMTLPLC